MNPYGPSSGLKKKKAGKFFLLLCQSLHLLWAVDFLISVNSMNLEKSTLSLRFPSSIECRFLKYFHNTLNFFSVCYWLVELRVSQFCSSSQRISLVWVFVLFFFASISFTSVLIFIISCFWMGLICSCFSKFFCVVSLSHLFALLCGILI